MISFQINMWEQLAICWLNIGLNSSIAQSRSSCAAASWESRRRHFGGVAFIWNGMGTVVKVAGVEPCELKTQVADNQSTYFGKGGQNPQIAPQKSGLGDPELARIVAAWGELPKDYKRAIMAIVGSVLA